ncbi:MAG: hypothetical protein LYZ70_07895, partial [Nitrososphaerales archaeon]|nr:hypothetical protein [Nitrososphaerales archaeon]
PAYASEAPPAPIDAGPQPSEGDEAGGRHLEVHEEDVIIVPCPRCGASNMVRVEGEIVSTHLPHDPEGERKTVVADAVSRTGCKCSRCGEEFYLFVKHLEARTYAAEPSLSTRFREPKATVEAVGLRYDFDKNVWQKIVEDKIVGTVRLTGKNVKGRGEH